eukprot:CAMPEP_0206145588 /NCGR_PEP_ID=MMETSP1473-20131121/27834_1 /ASSEMBLY_ACC=CAM_ASM_001109 /TAXON_ID=1461547 /ORGANISM="Stichococcus sp, Strain RCC1054" /LENGTH=163 /DNA_ID=CAMNT_0053541853 /DNA_START=151 /DNA_END=637 /DNA_ORIENTATION=+
MKTVHRESAAAQNFTAKTQKKGNVVEMALQQEMPQEHRAAAQQGAAHQRDPAVSSRNEARADADLATKTSSSACRSARKDCDSACGQSHRQQWRRRTVAAVLLAALLAALLLHAHTLTAARGTQPARLRGGGALAVAVNATTSAAVMHVMLARLPRCFTIGEA